MGIFEPESCMLRSLGVVLTLGIGPRFAVKILLLTRFILRLLKSHEWLNPMLP
jgi:hypothetical protein